MSSEEQIREDAANPGEEIRSLRKQIEYHSDRYYNMDAPEISDYEYDMMMRPAARTGTGVYLSLPTRPPHQKGGRKGKAGGGGCWCVTTCPC